MQKPTRAIRWLIISALLLTRCAAERGAPPATETTKTAARDFESTTIDGDLQRPTPNLQKETLEKPNATIGAFAGQAIVRGAATGESVADMYFRHYGTNPTIDTGYEARSTFSIDVDTAGYTMARAYLSQGQLPPEAAVRVEEMVNAIDYGYEAPTDAPFTLVGESAPSPTRPGYQFLHLGLKAKEVSKRERQPTTLVFVIDVSGSMGQDNRLALVKRAMRLLLGELDARDRVGVVVYGSDAHVLLPVTSATDKERIAAAIDDLGTEGSTNMQAGLNLGYTVLSAAFEAGHNHRIILCSDGVANNGLTDADALWGVVKDKAKKGITISTVGFGMGGYNDVLMERLAQVGDGNYAYVDREDEAHRVFVEGLTGTLQVIARDTKIQVEFDPAVVLRYRLVGYENRLLASRDFADDQKDAGEVGAGRSVTAIYEVKLRDQARDAALGVVRIRYKTELGAASTLLERPIKAAIKRKSFEEASPATRLSFVAAGFGEKLRGSYWARPLSYDTLLRVHAGLPKAMLAQPRIQELGELIRTAKGLDQRQDRFEAEEPLAQMSFEDVPIVRRAQDAPR
ncbi:MAG: von Willebrand factor type A domain-containing protein [Myxococcota bacterium]